MDPKPVNLKPASMHTEETYDPQGSGMEHDAFFASVAPGVAHSGNLAHAEGAPGDHSISTPSPANLKGE